MVANDFSKRLQRYVVNAGIDMTVLRGRPCPAGTMEAAHRFFYDLDLAEFHDLSSFSNVLDRKTEELRRLFPVTGRFWGRARKCINIFLRNSTYSYYLREKYALANLEPLLELPLDSNVASGLRGDAVKYGLNPPPKWDAIIRLNPEINDRWQSLASQVAHRKGTNRVHLDLWYWRALPARLPAGQGA